jgi:phosphopantothenoylcysteine decarboxylase/phosphopantothenate--cysteine ligase
MANVLALAARPISREELAAASSDDAIASLVELGVLAVVDAPSPPAIATPPERCKHLVIGLTGAIGVAGALDLVVELAARFAERVDVVISEGATRFIQPRLYAYHGFATWLDPFEPAHGVAVPHKHLAGADLVLVAPASASTLSKLAAGACADLLGLVVAITKAPVVLVPSMNPQMWRHPPIQRNVAQLREDGFWIVEPGLGTPVAARDEVGVGGGGVDIAGLIRALDTILAK